MEIYCGDAMKRYLGYLVDDAESRTINTNDNDESFPKTEEGNDGVKANSTKQATPNVISDMGKYFFCLH